MLPLASSPVMGWALSKVLTSPLALSSWEELGEDHSQQRVGSFWERVQGRPREGLDMLGEAGVSTVLPESSLLHLSIFLFGKASLL